MSLNPERDAEIVTLYKAGASPRALGQRYNLTRGRISQILIAAGITQRDNPRAPRGDLYAFVGVNVTKKNKAALLSIAKKQGKSMSEFVNELIEAEIAAAGK